MAISPVRTGLRAQTLRDRWPGLVLCACAVPVALGVHRLAGAIPALTAALALGVLAAGLGAVPEEARAGVRFAASHLMRAGIVLLGAQVTVGDVLRLGPRTIAMAMAVLLATFCGTQWLGRRIGLPPRTSLLVAAGFAICGASAVAAVADAVGAPGDSEADRDAATAITLVTLCGTLAIALMPAAGRLLGLSPYDTGRWIGASVHDVGQVVATATIVGPAALAPAVAVKLARVAMLAPVTAVTGFAARRRGPVPGADGARRPPVLPVFLLGFLTLVAVRSTGVLPGVALAASAHLRDLLLAAAMFGLGCAVRPRDLAGADRRSLLLGLASWLLIAGVSYAGVLITR
jgi:uncharacterized integral membrane protein (TIGR00698 family)